MAEEKKGKTPPIQQTPPGKISPVTEDWEAAFRAEDYLFTPEGENIASPAAQGKVDIPADGIERGPKPRLPLGVTGKFTTLLGKFFPLSKSSRGLPSLPTGAAQLLHRWKTLSLGRRLLAVGVVGCALLLVVGMFFIQRHSPPVVTNGGERAADSTGHAEQPQELPTHMEEAIESGKEVPIHGKLRWPLAAFLIATMPEAGDHVPVLVSVELTLVAAEGENGELQPDQIAQVRDIIYQFFANRPLSELRRYSIARGDMRRDLLAWIKKQWPAAAVETVLINRFQLS